MGKKLVKGIGYTLLALIVIFNLFVLLTGRTYLYKGIANTYLKGRSGPSVNEYNIFSNRVVKAGTPQPWPLSKNYNKYKMPDWLRKEVLGLDPIAFLVIKNDSIQYEEYWDIGSDSSLTNSFSMAKSIMGVLVGMAIRDGYIESVDQPVADFIPEFRNGKKQKITIKHLLTMSSGIGFDEDYVNPLAYPAVGYYGSNLQKLTLQYEVKDEPGKVFKYLSGDSQLLGFIIKAATGKTVAEYASEKLWKNIGAEHDAYWSLDREEGVEKSFCCFNTNARDFARLGKLIKDYGNWNGKQLLDSSYVFEATHPAKLVDENGNPNKTYGYQWWMMDYKNMHIAYMRGILGQYVIPIPDKNMIVIRLGKRKSKEKTPEGYPIDAFNYMKGAMEMMGVK